MPYHILSPLNQFFVAIPPYVSYCLRESLPDDNILRQEAEELLEDARFFRYLQEQIGMPISQQIKGAFWKPGCLGVILLGLKMLLIPFRLLLSPIFPIKTIQNRRTTEMFEKKMQKSQSTVTTGAKNKIIFGLVLFGIAILLIWAGPFAPKKDVVVTTEEFPRLEGREGTSVAYLVYYVWDGKQEEHPWWVILQAPLKTGGFEWAVLEVADIGDISDPDKFSGAFMSSLTRFDENWFDNEMHNVQRTRMERLQHILSGNNALKKERDAIDSVLTSIELPDK